jgi:hypothetical protein
MNEYAKFVEWMKQNSNQGTLCFNVIATEDIAQETGLDIDCVNSYLEQMEECEDGFHYCYFIEQFRDRGVEMCEFRWDYNL